jgi:hypothetical protein
MMPLYIATAVALICFILYALDCRMKGDSIDWISALKLSSIGAILSGGVGYMSVTPDVAETVKSVAPVVEAAQEMFVGTPTF